MGVIRRNSYLHTTVSVEVDPAELEQAGWHFEDDCPMREPELAPGSMDVRVFRSALVSLHRQAHPDQHRQPELCHREPCVSFPLGLLVEGIGHR